MTKMISICYAGKVIKKRIRYDYEKKCFIDDGKALYYDKERKYYYPLSFLFKTLNDVRDEKILTILAD